MYALMYSLFGEHGFVLVFHERAFGTMVTNCYGMSKSDDYRRFCRLAKALSSGIEFDIRQPPIIEAQYEQYTDVQYSNSHLATSCLL